MGPCADPRSQETRAQERSVTGHSQGVERDYHIPVAARIFLDRQTKVFDHARHPAYSQVYAENVYGKAMDESKRMAHGKVVRLVSRRLA